MSEFKTPNGKVIATYNVPGTAHVGIKFTTGGELPTELSGLFTSVRVADQMIGAYLGKLGKTGKEKPAKGQ